MNYRVPNWHEYQHYRDRQPPWVKLHRKLLRNRAFRELPILAKALLPLAWLLASEDSSDGTINGPAGYIAERLGMVEKDVENGLSSLMLAGFLTAASDLLAPCELPLPVPPPVETKPPPPDCPHEQIVALYHELLPTNPRVRFWTGPRRGYLRARWLEDPKRQRLEWWRSFFEYVGRSRFLTGRTNGTKDRAPFAADLEWLVRPTNFVHVIEGKYEK